MSENTKISIDNMNLHYGNFHALKGINMEIPEKEITAFIGPSGCGKSTLLEYHSHTFTQKIHVHISVNIFPVKLYLSCDGTAFHKVIHTV